MSRIRAKNTQIEQLAFRYLRRERIYFQKHYKKALGGPDIALPRKKKAVFIDGDFWHGWKFAQRKNRLPATYWREKIQKNMERDRRNTRKLRRSGWKVLRIWEHDLKGKRKEKTLEKIKSFLLN